MKCCHLALLLLGLFWCVVEIHSQQTFPYVSFMGQTLANHSYVDLTLVENEYIDGHSVQCHTDLSTCCSEPEGPHRGDWYFPDGNRLPFPDGSDIIESRNYQRVDLRRNSGTGPAGIYRCDIETNSVHDNGLRETVYVGLYASGGDVRISGDIVYTVVSDLNGPTPQFTLTCISTGGPATTVTWTRDSTTVTKGTETVLDNPETAQYNHTLTVIEKHSGLYMCSVANNKPSHDSASLLCIVKLQAEVGEREVMFTWSPPTTVQQNTRAIVNYTLSCSPSPSSLPQTHTQLGSLTVAGFSPNTLYSCSLLATHTCASGTPAITNFTTLQDYVYFQLRLRGVAPCSEFTVTLTEEKLEDVKSALLEQLKLSCAECSSDTIDMQSFSCYEKSPTHITYRARLEGTSEIDSDTLISVIEEWVRGEPSIIVTGVLMAIDSQCSVAITALSEPECFPSPTTVPEMRSQTPSIVAGVVVVIIVIVIATAAPISILLILKKKNLHRSLFKSKTSHNFLCRPKRARVSIHTSTNKAYARESVSKPAPQPATVLADYEPVNCEEEGGNTVKKDGGSSKDHKATVPALPLPSEDWPVVPGESENPYD